MTASWKVEAERALMEASSPSVMTTAMVHTLVTAGRDDGPSPATFTRWISAMAAAGKLREVIKGVYLNRLGHRDVSPAAAACWVRTRSVVSLSWVLEQAHITNNFGDTITCVIPTESGLANPRIGDRLTSAGTFRFFAMPARLVDERAGLLEDIRDLRFDYARATPEKALLDWIYLGASGHSRMTRPPMDLDIASLNQPRLKRLIKRMHLASQYETWMDRYRAYRADADVRENSSADLRL
ncbi:hypothetical protein FN976_24375 [Caenimonas sedimenti]|uniref:Uncharacterized protein n=1 Tax=Caenimonas sedimenti TaxID=2596921 RepID=A0A562ZIB8_9BURK|nr:hypothetical protein [Caenimonas sedimenti]TWO68076.1 hypothetical protein FN976_24375 [Caenimonas sedimenti]